MKIVQDVTNTLLHYKRFFSPKKDDDGKNWREICEQVKSKLKKKTAFLFIFCGAKG